MSGAPSGWPLLRAAMALLLVFMLIVLNGVFSLSEIALVSARKSRLAAEAEDGDQRAAAALKLA